jgi:flagellar biogenesis protein FliO
MPSTVRIIVLILPTLFSGIVFAQEFDSPSKQPSADEFDSRPPLLQSPAAPAQMDMPAPVAGKSADLSAKTANAKEKAPPLTHESPIPLSPPGKSSPQSSGGKSYSPPSIAALAGGLGVVLGVFLLIAWLLRRTAPRSLMRLPGEAFEVLGRAPLADRQNVHLLRCGNKLLLVSTNPAGTETLTEITDPSEVDRLAGICRQAGRHSSTAAFQRVFEQLAPKRSARTNSPDAEYAGYDLSELGSANEADWEHDNA